ncbi:MAG: glycine cleavage system protein GcvH [Natronincolaceae bacterium]|jgi:glycine cleavage system H protein|nr:glycine cleavage system protein GcvH [Bacillota bacterium]NLK90039.1 glycine cleavage system protein GcvH [Clostridiales bacterium]
MKIVEGNLYTKDHEWVKIDGGEAFVGISDHAQHSLGDIVYVELPEVGDEFDKGDAFAVVESTKAASDVFLPVAGKVVEVNEALDDAPELINEDAFANWIAKIELSGDADTSDLMDAAAYKEFCDNE